MQTPVAPCRTSATRATRAASTRAGDPFARIRPASDAENLNICENLYKAVNATVPPLLGLRPRAACRAEREVLEGRARLAGGKPAEWCRRSTRRRGTTPRCTRVRCSSRTGCVTASTRSCRERTACRSAARSCSSHPRAIRANDLEFLPSGDMLYVDRQEQRGAARRVRGHDGEPPADRSRGVEHHVGSRAADRRVRRGGIDRSRPRRRAHLRVGPGRRRPVRRLEGAEADLHVHEDGHLQRCSCV